MTWKPIKTHRHTDEDVLVYVAKTGEQFVAYWDDADAAWIYARVKDQVTVMCKPTHWRPLPEPPDQEVSTETQQDQGRAA